eukprot:m.80799 g.80799  ORF g.80799 m.80799 type:complete len:650 (+) comp14672_c0_seq5:1267-3216(+)
MFPLPSLLLVSLFITVIIVSIVTIISLGCLLLLLFYSMEMFFISVLSPVIIVCLAPLVFVLHVRQPIVCTSISHSASGGRQTDDCVCSVTISRLSRQPGDLRGAQLCTTRPTMATSSPPLWLCMVVLFAFAVVVRWSVGLHPHSGQGVPPKHGDFEAQRHWMELTWHLPVSSWYWPGPDNDLLYWGLDYPPLTAYGSWLCGYVADAVLGHPEWVALHTSRGAEGPDIKLFMRATVLVADLVLLFPAIWALASAIAASARQGEVGAASKRTHTGKGSVDGGGNEGDGGDDGSPDDVATTSACPPGASVYASSSVTLLVVAAVMLFSPGLILIDHGHFQYNGVSLGLVAAAMAAVLRKRDWTASALFVLALNYKQMCLYFAPVYFFYLLGKSLASPRPLVTVAAIGVVVIATFAVCWLPFLTSVDHVLQILHRLFPFSRGLFEDKVANFWFVVDTAIKLRRRLPIAVLSKLSLGTTLVAFLPSCAMLLRKPTGEQFLYSSLVVSLSFFLFSFQVHEKSVLIPAMAAGALVHREPLAACWFIAMSTFSMYPLLEKDGLPTAYIGTMLLFGVTAYLVLPQATLRSRHFLVCCLSLFGAAMLHVLALVVPPPARLPHIHVVAMCLYSAAHFLVFWVYFNLRQYLNFVAPKPKTQ